METRLDDILTQFAALTGDAVAIGIRRPQDPFTRMLWVNTAFEDLFGFSLTEILGRFVTFTIHPAHRKEFYERIDPVMASGQTATHAETFIQPKDGRCLWASLSLFQYPTEDGGRYTACVFRDLSELKARETAAEVALAERDRAFHEIDSAQTRLVEAINAVPDAISIWDKDLNLIVANSAAVERDYGAYSDMPSKVTLSHALHYSIGHGNMSVNLRGDLDAYVDGLVEKIRREPTSGLVEYRGGRHFLNSTKWTESGNLIIMGTEVTEMEVRRKQLEELAAELRIKNAKVQYQANHDELTGLGNRRFLTLALDEMKERLVEEGGAIQALHIDLDRFKHVNDTQGHAVGDALLQFVARVLDRLRSSEDKLARIGGDEFVILRLSSDTMTSPEDLAATIIDALGQPIELMGTEVRIGASVGIASTDVSPMESLLTDSDVALYKAKSMGRNGYQHFCRTDRQKLEDAKRLSDDLLRGLEAREFVPAFQPQICVRTGRLLCFEVLARWDHPTKGVLSPAAFLGIAEDLGVEDQIDAMMFDTALMELPRHFTNEACPSLSFNVSHRRLMSKALIKDAQRARSFAGGISFELLESVYLDETDTEAQLQIDALKALGAGIEIDDFGSGHASIIGLGQVAPDRLKIDRRLVEPIAKTARALTLVRSIVEIAQAFQIEVIAEGVETVAQALHLRNIKCDRLQGYLIGRPTLSADLAPLVASLRARTRAA